MAFNHLTGGSDDVRPTGHPYPGDDMKHSHSHSEKLPFSQFDRKRVRILLGSIVVPLFVATLVGMFFLWPRGETPVGQEHIYAEGVSEATGVVTFVGETDDYGQTPVRMETDGVEVDVHVPFEYIDNGLDVGDRIITMFSPDIMATGSPYIFVDFERSIPMSALVVFYIIAVAIVARGKGLAAIAGLGASLAIVGFFMLPALLVGKPALVVVLVGAAAMMFASIYLAHGISIRTTTAILGTFGGLIVTGVVAYFAIGANNLTGVLTEEAITLYSKVTGLQMDQILLCGMILAGLGALNDVTITQVSTVWELHGLNPQATRLQLFRRGMVVGRDHIASTVYTLAFAYIGTALPLMLSAAMIDRGFLDTMAVAQVSEEIVRTLVASIGLVLAIPATTAIAATLAPVAPTGARVTTRERNETGAHVTCGERAHVTRGERNEKEQHA